MGGLHVLEQISPSASLFGSFIYSPIPNQPDLLAISCAVALDLLTNVLGGLAKSLAVRRIARTDFRVG